MFTGIITGVNVKAPLYMDRENHRRERRRAGEGNWWHEPKVIHTA